MMTTRGRGSSTTTVVKTKTKSSVKPRAPQPKAKPRTSRTSPPPQDDFDADILQDTKDYVEERKNEAERTKVREENAKRKKEGLTLLKLPPKYKPPKRHRRRRDSLSAPDCMPSSDDEDDRFLLEYEGQKILPFDPLPILTELAQSDFKPDEIISQMNPDSDRDEPPPRRQRDALPHALRGTLGIFEGVVETGNSTAQPDVKDVKAKTEANLEQDTKLDLKGSVNSEQKSENNNTNVKPDLKPDIKPEILCSPPAPASSSNQPDEKPDITIPHSQTVSTASDPKSSLPDVKPDITTAVDDAVDVGADDEEEDYDENDIIVVPWQNTSSSGKEEKPVVKPEPGVKLEPAPGAHLENYQPSDSDEDVEEEEIYSEEEYLDSLARTSTLATQQSQSLDPFSMLDSKLLEAMTERPNFMYTDEQRLIPPFQLDPDDESIVIPASINRFLRGYQRNGVWFLYQKYKQGMGGILGDDMGLGKTVQVIAFLSAIMRKTGTAQDAGRRKMLIRRSQQLLAPQKWATALLVCPTSLIPNWARELETWGYFEYEIWTTAGAATTLTSMEGGYLDIILISHDLLSKAADDLKKLPFSVIILDEAHRMKKPRGNLGLAIKKIPCRSCFALTGTLIQNRMEEMWSVLDFRGWAGTLKEWREFIVKPINRGHRHDGKIKEVTEAIYRLGQVYSNILPHFYLRRDKRLIAHELPQKRDLVVLCPLAEHQEAVYRRVIESDDVKFILMAKEPCECGSGNKRSLCCHQVNSVGDDLRVAILKMFDALGRIANHMALLYYNSSDSEQVQAVNRRVFEFCTGTAYDPARHSAIEATFDPRNCGKWALLKSMLLEWRSKPEEHNKVLLFSNSVRLLKYIEDFINMSDELGTFDFSLFSGDVDKAQRMEMVDRFQDPNSDHFLMLVSTMAGGVGLNLTAANKVIIFDPNWNPANDLQAMDRAFRFGQKRPVDVYRFVTQGTIEELMYERQIYKQQRARQLNDGTYERRTHRGYEGAAGKEDKGELFGVHNIFRYDPAGYVKGNLERVRLAEDKLRQDFVDQEFDSEGDEDEDEESKLIRQQRRDKAIKRAALDSEKMDEIMSDGMSPKRVAETSTAGMNTDELLTRFGLTSLEHNEAFRDSPEERQIYERGIKLLLERPDLQDIPANEIGKVRLPSEREAKRAKRTEPVLEEAPWQERFSNRKMKGKAAKNLVDLDD